MSLLTSFNQAVQHPTLLHGIALLQPETHTSSDAALLYHYCSPLLHYSISIELSSMQPFSTTSLAAVCPHHYHNNYYYYYTTPA